MERALIAVLLALSFVACGSPSPESDGRFSVIVPGDGLIEPLPVDLVDQTGTVVAMGIAKGGVMDGVVADPADPAVLVVSWTGGTCDVRTTLTVEPTIDTIRISEATEERPGGCLLAGIARSIAIRFEPRLPMEVVEFVRAES